VECAGSPALWRFQMPDTRCRVQRPDTAVRALRSSGGCPRRRWSRAKRLAGRCRLGIGFMADWRRGGVPPFSTANRAVAAIREQ
jgi:hypothetical protein